MTQKLFPFGGGESLREARLIFKDGPTGAEGERTGTDIRELKEKLEPRYSEVITALHWAANELNNPEIKKLLADREMRQMIAVQVLLLPGTKSAQYMNPIALTFLKKTHEAFAGEGKAIDGAKNTATELAKKSAEIFRNTLVALKEQSTAYTKAGGKDFPALSDDLTKLLGEGKDFDTFKQKFDAIINLTKDALWATDPEMQIVADWVKKLKDIDVTDSAVLDPFLKAKDATDKRTEFLKILQKTATQQLLNKKDRETVEGVVRNVDAAISDVNRKIDGHIQERFAARVLYLDRLGGSHAGALIALSIDEEGKFDQKFLTRRLAIIRGGKETDVTSDENTKLTDALHLNMPEVGDATGKNPKRKDRLDYVKSHYGLSEDQVKGLLSDLLKGGRQQFVQEVQKLPIDATFTDKCKEKLLDEKSRHAVVADFIGTWNTDAAEECLTKDLKFRNPVGVSLPAEALRARMPPETVKLLEAGQYRPAPGVLISIAKLKQFGKGKMEVPFTQAEAKAKLDTFFEPDAAATPTVKGWYKIDKLTELIASILNRGDDPAAKLQATVFINNLLIGATKPIRVSTRPGRYVVDTSAQKILLEAAIGALKKEVEDPSTHVLGKESATQIVESVLEQRTGGTGFNLKDRDLLFEYLKFLHFDKDGKAAEDAAKDFREKKLEQVGGPITKGSNGTYLVDDKDALIRALSVIAVNDTTTNIYNEMRLAKVHEDPTWKQIAGMHAQEFWELTKHASGVWYDYIKTLPRLFWDKPGDEQLLQLLDQRSALNSGRKTLQGLLDASSGAQKMLVDTEKGLRSRKEAQDKALRGDPAVSPSEHAVQARALVLANFEVIKNELGPSNWETRTKRLKQFTLWTAMLKHSPQKNTGPLKEEEAYKGVKDAKDLLHAAASYSPERQDKFVDEKLRELSIDQRASWLRYSSGLDALETAEGRDNLAPLKQRGLSLKPRALDILRRTPDAPGCCMNVAASVGRWLIDPPSIVAKDVALVLEDTPAKEPTLRAFVTGEKQSYPFQSRTEIVTVTDAQLAISAIQQRLLFEMRGNIKAREQLKDEEEFSNPVDSWLRTGVDSMKELWNTDMIGKVEVVAIVAASAWLLHKLWKDTKWGKFAIVGVPILLGANAIVKQRTGRDLLGENLRYKNQEDRNSPLEAFRRRGAAIDSRYAVLMQPSGQAAMRVLMNEKNPISVRNLIAWRAAVKSNINATYTLGRPSNLQIGEIEDALGAKGNPESASEVAYKTFESLCVDVARLNGRSGSVDSLAEQGADLICRKYVTERNASLPPATMFEVIMSECQMPTKEMLENRNYLEALAAMLGYGYDEALGLVKKYGTKAVVIMRQGVHEAPKVAGAVKDWVFASAEDTWNWMRTTGTKLWPEAKEDLKAAWDLISGTCSAAGVYLVREAPNLCKWTVDKAVAAGGMGKYAVLSALSKIRGNGITGPMLDWVIEQFNDTFGLNLKKEWFTEEHLKECADYKKFKDKLVERVQRFAVVGPDFGAKVNGWMKEVSGKDPTGTEYEKLPERQRMLAQEVVEKNIFCKLAAERMHQIDKKMGDKDYKGVDIPLTINPWADKLADIGKDAAGNGDKVFEYLSAHYRPDIILPLIGNELTFVGTMERWKEKHPELKRATFAEVLLYPGFLQAVTQDSAVDFVPHEVHAYVAEYAEKAEELKKKGIIDETQRDAYLRYLDCLETNVAFEAILAQGTGEKDLLLTKDIAKTLHARLMEYRGIAPQVKLDEIFKPGDPLGGLITTQFKKPDPLPDIPAEITKVTKDKRGHWLLSGTTPIDENQAAVTAAQFAQKIEQRKKDLTKPVDGTEWAKLSDPNFKADSESNRRELLSALQRPGLDSTKEAQLRQKFKNNPPDVTAIAEGGSLADAIDHLLGMPKADAGNYYNKMKTAWLSDAATLDKDQRASRAQWLCSEFVKKRAEHPKLAGRAQRFLDQTSASLLDGLVNEVAAVSRADLEKLRTDNNSKYKTWLATLDTLWTATARIEGAAFSPHTDAVSAVREWLLYSGESGHFDEYTEERTKSGFPCPKKGTSWGITPGFASDWSKMQTRMNDDMTKTDGRRVKSTWNGQKGALNSELGKPID